MQRLRLSFGRDERQKYISHLDMMRLWQRVFRRADIPLAHSQGFNPHPKISTAAPLAVGVTTDCELMDIYLETNFDPSSLLERIRPQLPLGIWVSAGEEVPVPSASLPSILRYAEYEIGMRPGLTGQEIERRIADLLAASSLPRERLRDGRARNYDLRPLIDDLKVVGESDGFVRLWMRLQANPSAAGRPEEVVAALGIPTPPCPIKRVGLIFEKVEKVEKGY